VRARWPQFATSFMFLFGSMGIALAQTSQDIPPEVSPSPDDPVISSPAPLTSDQIVSQMYLPLSLGEKYLYTFDRVLGPGALFADGIHGLFDYALDRPHQWGTEGSSIGLRAASVFGRSFLRENIAFGVRAFDHEDPRYFRSGQGNLLSRTRYAAVHTFLVRKDSGGTMPAYSLFVAGSTMPFLAQSWRPEEFSAARGVGGAFGIMGFAVVANLWNEFWPDIRAKLPRKLGGGVRTNWFGQDYRTSPGH
jgi:hypothetical protein